MKYFFFLLFFTSCMSSQSILNTTEISKINVMSGFNKSGTTASLKAAYSSFLINGGVKTSFDSNQIEIFGNLIKDLKGNSLMQKKIPNVLFAIEIIVNDKAQCLILTNSKLINITSGVEYFVPKERHKEIFSLISSIY